MKKLFLISSTAEASEFYFTKSEIEEVYSKYNRDYDIIILKFFKKKPLLTNIVLQRLLNYKL